MKYFLLILSTFLTFTLKAQKNNIEGFDLSFHTGLMFSNIAGTEADLIRKSVVTKNRTSIYGELEIAKYFFQKRIYILSGLGYMKLGTKFLNGKDKLEGDFFRFPFLIGYRLSNVTTGNLYLQSGLGVSKNIGGSINLGGERNEITTSFILGLRQYIKMNEDKVAIFKLSFFTDLTPYYEDVDSNQMKTGSSLGFYGLAISIGFVL